MPEMTKQERQRRSALGEQARRERQAREEEEERKAHERRHNAVITSSLSEEMKDVLHWLLDRP